MLGFDQADFGATGWAVIPAFLDAGDRTFCAAAVDAVLSLPQHLGMRRPGNDLVPLRWDHPVVERILTSEKHIDRLRRVLGARDLRWLSAYVSTKPPYSPPVVVAPGLVVLGPSNQLRASGYSGRSSVLPHGHQCAKWRAAHLARLPSQEHAYSQATA
jgi:hypothetical protein